MRSHRVLSDPERARGIRRVLVVTLVLNLVVAALKVAYGMWSGSLSIRADGFHSATDGLNNIVLILGSWLAAAPPDREHPYGHKKLEVFAAGVIGVALLVVAVDVIRDVMARFMGHSEAPRIDAVAFVILGVTLAMNVFVARWEKREGERLMSPGLMSDAAHTKSDVLVTLGVAATAALTWAGLPWLDVVAGALVATVIATTGIRIVKENAGYLMDTSLVDPAQVSTVARSVPGVIDARDVRSRGSPGGVWVELVVEVEGAMTVRDAHSLAHGVEDALRLRFPGVLGVSVHVEPKHALPDPGPRVNLVAHNPGTSPGAPLEARVDVASSRRQPA
jgi:cation diffusion facilitator family transporter